MADSKLSDLTQGTIPALYYARDSGGASKRFSSPRVLNVLDFGADNSGVADSTSAIQSCFDAAFGSAASPHGDANKHLNRPVYFPAGGYKITSPLRLTDVASGQIFGDGKLCTSINWSGSSFNGNTMGNGAYAEFSCMLEVCGLAAFRMSDMQWFFGSAQANNTVVIYLHTGGSIYSTGNIFDNVSIVGGAYGIYAGPNANNGNNISEQFFNECRIVDCGTCGVVLDGQNTLNYDFINCSFNRNGTMPITSTFTGKIDNGSGGGGKLLTVTSMTVSASNPKLASGLIIYDTAGNVVGNTRVSSLGTGTGGIGTYNLSAPFNMNVAAGTLFAMPPNPCGVLNASGSMPIIHGCDATGQVWDYRDYSSNPLHLAGCRTESINVASIAGTPVVMDAIYSTNQAVVASCTSTGPILHVNSIVSGAGPYLGMLVTGNDGAGHNLSTDAGAPPIPGTVLLKQLTSPFSDQRGDWLMSRNASGGNLTTCNVTGRNIFLELQGGGDATLTACKSPTAVITGNNDARLRIRSNNFWNNGSTNPDLFIAFSGQILEYDVAANNLFTVADLPTASAIFKGVRMFVRDSSVTTFGTIIVGGGSTTVPVYCDGTNWKVG